MTNSSCVCVIADGDDGAGRMRAGNFWGGQEIIPSWRDLALYASHLSTSIITLDSRKLGWQARASLGKLGAIRESVSSRCDSAIYLPYFCPFLLSNGPEC